MKRFGPELLERLAQEYALGTLHGRARRRFEAIVRDWPEGARAVAQWQQRLARLAPAVAPIEPSAALWQGLQQRLFAPAPAPRRRFAWAWPSLGGALAGAMLAVLVLQIQPAWLPRPGADTGDVLPASYVGVLSDRAGQATMVLSSARHGRRLAVKVLHPLAVPPGQVARLWALPADGRAPFAVGVVPAQGKATLALPDSSETLFAQVPRLGVRLEPADGAEPPTPDSFALSGPCVKVW